MKILIGLGNPSNKYENNRHNVGQLFIKFFISQPTNLHWQVKNLKEKNKLLSIIFSSDNLILVKPHIFMNQSGKVVKKILNLFNTKSSHLYIIHDDLDIPLGKFKIQFSLGPKLHNGLKSIEEVLKTKDFWRIRIGVDNRKKENWIDGENYVLQNFLIEEKKLLETEIFPKIYQRLINSIKIP